MIIDVHAHVLQRELLPSLGYEKTGDDEYRLPGWQYGPLDKLVYDLDGRLQSLRDRNIDLQLVGPPPRFVCNIGNELTVERARLVNSGTAAMVAKSGGLLAGLSAIAWAEPARAAAELERAVGEHGFKGAIVGTTAGGRVLDSPEFEPIFAMMDKLRLVVFMHSVPGAPNPALDDYTLRVLVGYPFETSLAASRLIFAGVLERHPNINLVLSHGGGTLPFLKGRLNRGYEAPHYEYNPDCHAHISKPPGDYFQQIYFDTCVLSPQSLRFMIQVVGVDRVVFGSDFPFEIGDADGKVGLQAISEMPKGDRDKILGDNIARALAVSGTAK
jgi:aminocarboxymuconate-semialdehyde decarboxylase